MVLMGDTRDIGDVRYSREDVILNDSKTSALRSVVLYFVSAVKESLDGSFDVTIHYVMEFAASETGDPARINPQCVDIKLKAGAKCLVLTLDNVVHFFISGANAIALEKISKAQKIRFRKTSRPFGSDCVGWRWKRCQERKE